MKCFTDRLTHRSPGAQLRALWGLLSRVPGGRRLFSMAIGKKAPYTGTIGAEVVELRPGYAKLVMRDRHAVRNHLDCVHAIALMNLAEETTGLAMNYQLPDGIRGIVTHLSIEYFKKARGTLTAESSITLPDVTERQTLTVEGTIRDAAGERVATAKAVWLVGPER